MQGHESLAARPKIVSAALLAQALSALRSEAHAPTDMWRLLTDRYVVDLDAAAAVLPVDESKTVWLTARG